MRVAPQSSPVALPFAPLALHGDSPERKNKCLIRRKNNSNAKTGRCLISQEYSRIAFVGNTTLLFDKRTKDFLLTIVSCWLCFDCILVSAKLAKQCYNSVFEDGSGRPSQCRDGEGRRGLKFLRAPSCSEFLKKIWLENWGPLVRYFVFCKDSKRQQFRKFRTKDHSHHHRKIPPLAGAKH